MITPITNITLADVERLRKKPLATNGKSIEVTNQEIEDMKKHLSDLYDGQIKATFADRITRANKVY